MKPNNGAAAEGEEGLWALSQHTQFAVPGDGLPLAPFFRRI